MSEYKGKISKFIKFEENKVRFMELINVNPLTRNELAIQMGVDKSQIQRLIKALTNSEAIVIHKPPKVCTVSGRTMQRFIPTEKGYTPKNFNAEQKARALVREAIVEEVVDNRYVVVEAPNVTTYYLSRRHQPKNPNKKRTSISKLVSIASGMSMFSNWE
jgi:predicted ArsR family transcriptional regulator